VLAVVVLVVIVFARVVGAGFVEFDDDIHVYANPMLNPLSIDSVGRFWRQPYQGLYIPLAYTILAGVSLFARIPAEVAGSIGRVVTLSPTPFHVASLCLHVANSVLCYLLALRLTRNRMAAFVCAAVFALHPLQVESVAWISELRGLSSACFGLGALSVFVVSRQSGERDSLTSRGLLAASALLAVCAMLCKPAALALPLVMLAMDRVALGTSWRRSILTALAQLACLLPFAVLTRSVQALFPGGASLWWQRPFVAGEALAFYLRKIVVPIDLTVEYGRTPHSVMSHGWSFLAWVVPASLMALCFIARHRRPVAWLGALMFVSFLLPTLGLVPFTFQVHSTVADRYAYLAMMGMGLIIGDLFTAVRPKLAVPGLSLVLLVFAILSIHQSGYWTDNAAFLRHTIAVNPEVAFAQNNVGSILLRENRADEAIEHFQKALQIQPDDALAENNLGLALVQLRRLDEAALHFRRAVELNPSYFKAYESLGAVYLQTNHLEAAIDAFRAALAIQPSEAKALNDLGIAFMRSGRPEEGLDAFQQAVRTEPTNPQYRQNLGRALLQMGRAEEARPYLDRSDPAPNR
jgi:Flp pilus assembly protein TadD